MEDPPISRWVSAIWGDALTNHWRGIGLLLSDQPFKTMAIRFFSYYELLEKASPTPVVVTRRPSRVNGGSRNSDLAEIGFCTVLFMATRL
jgi:hypothetical protein